MLLPRSWSSQSRGNISDGARYDLEAWFPFQGEYKELVSCSNCTDYQTRELEIRFGTKKQTATRKEYVHALVITTFLCLVISNVIQNSTLCATERALCCVLENYQTPDGIVVPEVLRKYIPGSPEFLPWVRELPKDSTSQKQKGKADKKAPAEVEQKMKDMTVQDSK